MKLPDLKRGYNKLYNIVAARIREKTYLGDNQVAVKYMLFRKEQSDTLMVVFPAYNRKGAYYNYLGTLKSFKVNKLFIKDDFGLDHLGNFLLGKKNTYSVEKTVNSLISDTIRKCNAQKVIFIGSSKGGYCALNFGLRYENAKIVIAAPQYFLGSYLSGKKNKNMLIDIAGEEWSESDIQELDKRLENIISTDAFSETQKVYLHYSPKAEEKDGHCTSLIAALKGKGICYEENIGDYPEHWQLKYYFPQYLEDTVRTLLQ